MAFEPKKIYGSDFNGGIKYSLTDGFSPDDFNNIIEGLLYAQENGGSGGGVDQELLDQINANTQEIGHLQSDSSRQEQEIINHTDKIYLLEEKDKAILANTDGVLDEAVFKGVTNNSINLSSEEKTSALEWLGAVKKATQANLIYGTTTNYAVSFKPMGYAIPRYSTKDNLKTSTPVDDNDCTPKKYVDDKIAELLARIEALESK